MITSTYFALLSEFNTAQIPLDVVAEKYLSISSKRVILDMAARQAFPFPVFKIGTNKSPWFVSATDLAAVIDKKRDEAKAVADKLNAP